jgi:type VI secretion system secreted protein VgrG
VGAQDKRMLKMATPLGDDVVRLLSFRGREELSRLFSFELEVSIEHTKKVKPADVPKKLIGENVTFAAETPKGTRFFNGFVREVVTGDRAEKSQGYELEVVPWLWFLTQTSDCRIFQKKTIPQIIEDVFKDLGFQDFDTGGIKGDHKEWDYCVQYRETDFNFVSRLMEQEGIYYFFEHKDKVHKLILADSASGYVDCKEKEGFYPTSVGSNDWAAHITSWEHRYEFVSGKWAHTDYNFETPNTNLKTETKAKVKIGGNDKYEIYDYPGEYGKKGEGTAEVELRMEEEEVPHSVVSGTSHCKTWLAGGKFKIAVPPGVSNAKAHPVDDEIGNEYVITAITHQATEPLQYETGGGGVAEEYSNSYTCIPSDVEFRPARITPKPLVSGIQTAVVVGPKGEEIHTDKYGRVRVQFHWDRYGERDEKSSCWIRVAHNMAGKKWGFLSIPRIGQEVVVDFLEGDPDRPLVVGSVYNAEQMPHYDLPDNKTRSSIKTNSTKGGEGFNEIFFEDKKDDERLFMHAQKNMDVRVRNDSKERIYGNRHQIVGWEKDGKKGGSQRERVWQDKEVNIKRNQVEHVEGNLQFMVGNGEADAGGAADVVLEKRAAIKIGDEGLDLGIDGDVKQKIGGIQSLTVEGGRKEKLASLSLAVDGDVKAKVGGNDHLKVGMDQHTKVGMNSALDAGMAVHIKGGMNVVIEAGIQLTLKVGGNFVSLSPAGVAIQGTLVMINSGGAAGAGAGAKPQAPEAPDKPKDPEEAAPSDPEFAHKEKSGFKSSK